MSVVLRALRAQCCVASVIVHRERFAVKRCLPSGGGGASRANLTHVLRGVLWCPGRGGCPCVIPCPGAGCPAMCCLCVMGMYVSARVSLPLPHVDQWRPSTHYGVHHVMRPVCVSAHCLCVPTLAPSILSLVPLARVAVLCGVAVRRKILFLFPPSDVPAYAAPARPDSSRPALRQAFILLLHAHHRARPGQPPQPAAALSPPSSSLESIAATTVTRADAKVVTKDGAVQEETG